MADKKKKLDEKAADGKKTGKSGRADSTEQAEKTSKRRRVGRWFKWLLVLLLLVLLAAAGFAAGIYLKLFDVQTMAERWGMTEYPVVGKYLAPPKTNFETVPLDGETLPIVPNVDAATSAAQQLPLALPPANQKLDAAELQRLEKLKQQETAKAVGKLARLYGGMKAEEVVPIINQLDDAMVIAIFNKMEEDQVSKIMATMDAKRAASLSQVMMKGKLPAPPAQTAN